MQAFARTAARLEQWRATMNGATGPVGVIEESASPRSETADPSISHRCSGCEAGEPCSACGGNIRRDSPAYQALEWGLREAGAEPGSFWRGGRVSQAVRDAPARTGSADWTAIETMIRRSRDLATVLAQGQNASSAFARVVTESDELTLLGPASPYEFRVPGGWPTDVPGIPFELLGHPICCPTLIYPIPTPQHGKDRIGKTAWHLYHSFEALAIYKDEPPKPGPYCSCACCLFRQYIDTKITGTGLGPDGKPLPYQPTPGEDTAKDGSRFGRPGESKSCKGWTKKASCEDHIPVGGDTSALSPAAQKLLDDTIKAQGLKSYCVYYMRDYPGMLLGPGDSKTRSDCFIGVVKSRCPPCPIVRKGTFSLKVSGSVSATGTLTENEPSKGESRFKGDATCNIPAAEANDC